MKKNKFQLFEWFAIIILFLVTGFIVICLGTLIIGGFSALRESLFSEEIRFSITLSLVTATLSTLICIFLAIPCSYILARKDFIGKKYVATILSAPLSLPYIVLGLALLIVFSSEIGHILKDLGFKVVFDTTGIVFAQIIVNLPFVIKLITEAFCQIDPKLEFMAETLGANSWKRFTTITLGLSKKSIISTGMLAWSRGLGEFGATLMLVGVTRMVTETLPGSIFLNISIGDNDMAMASATILIVIAMTTLVVTDAINNKAFTIRRRR